MSVGAFPVVVFHDVATEKEIAYMQKEVRKQVRIYNINFMYMFSKKATKIDKILAVDLTVCTTKYTLSN